MKAFHFLKATVHNRSLFFSLNRVNLDHVDDDQ